MHDFLNKYGWSDSSPLAQDGSSRKYFRVFKSGKSAILMVAPPDRSEQSTRGHKISDFLRISDWLRATGLAAPEIYECDEDAGFVLMQDFGDLTFKKALSEKGAEALYGLGAQILNHIAESECDLELPNYYDSHVHAGRAKIMSFYYPQVTGNKADSALINEYLAIWDKIESSLPPAPQGFLHIDYHAENLMWREGETGLDRIGILDFQGAMIGPKPYDLANLLEDARNDVPEDLRDFILSHYDESFQAWYRVLATQFHCRLAGQFLELAENGKPQYLQYLPRVEKYIEDALGHDILKPLSAFFSDIGLAFRDGPAKKHLKTAS